MKIEGGLLEIGRKPLRKGGEICVHNGWGAVSTIKVPYTHV
jgi:hypothetical protein